MPDSCDRLRGKSALCKRRPLAGIQTHAAPSHAGGFAGGTLPVRRRFPATFSSLLSVPLRAGSFEADLRQKGGAGCGAPTVRGLPRLPAEPAGVAAGHRGAATALEAVAAGPVPIKHFLSFLSISLDFRLRVCQK